MGLAVAAPSLVRVGSLMKLRGVIMPTAYEWSMASTERLTVTDCGGDPVVHWVNTLRLRGFRDRFTVDAFDGSFTMTREPVLDGRPNHATWPPNAPAEMFHTVMTKTHAIIRDSGWESNPNFGLRITHRENA